MSLQDFSEIRRNALSYLGYKIGAEADCRTLSNLDSAIEELQCISSPQHRVCRLADLSEQPSFLKKKNYDLIRSFLPEASLFVATLGLAVDHRIRVLAKIDLAKSVVLNAAANAYLEHYVSMNKREDESLFCPGYSGTDFEDVPSLLSIFNAEKYLGIHTASSGLMIPEKSVAGMLLHNYKFSCRGCLLMASCEHRKNNTTCYVNQ